MKELTIDLAKLMDMEQFQELFNVLAENGEFNYSENGLNISAKSSDNALQLQVSYELPKPTAKSEAQDFQKFIETIDDDLFTDVCESLGGEQLSRIANCLNSNDIEAVTKANETVAKHCEKEGIPSVYRVHEEPDSEKIEKLVNY